MANKDTNNIIDAITQGMESYANEYMSKLPKKVKKANYTGDYNIDALESYLNKMQGSNWDSSGKRETAYNALINNMDILMDATKRKGSSLTYDEIKRLANPSKEWDLEYMYDLLVSQNYDALFGDGARQEKIDWATQAFANAMNNIGAGNQQLEIPEAGTLGADYQEYLNALNAVSDEKYNTALSEIQRSENDMYRAIGLSQRQMERDIAKRRQQALKSGMSTAQLAAQEQQNLLAAQTGATQIAQQYADQRYSAINQFAGANAQNYASALQSQIGWNQQAATANQAANNTWAQTMANAYAQFYSSDIYKDQQAKS